MLLITPQLDYFALLFIPLSVEAMLTLPLRAGYTWVGVFLVATAATLLVVYGLPNSLPFIFIYAAAFIFVASYATVTRQAEEARAEGQTLLLQLQAAHEQLQEYATRSKSWL